MRALPQLRLEGVPEPPPQREPGDLTAEEAFHQVFWPAYPRKDCKFAALQMWRRLKLSDDDQDTLDHIMRGLDYHKGNWDGKERDYIPHARTFLFQRRWEDVE